MSNDPRVGEFWSAHPTGAIESKLCDFIVGDLQWKGRAADLIGDSPVALPHILDSAELLELITYIEDEFEIEINDEEIEPGSFETVADVAKLIEAKGAAGG
jgi:acyl carrier protein